MAMNLVCWVAYARLCRSALGIYDSHGPYLDLLEDHIMLLIKSSWNVQEAKMAKRLLLYFWHITRRQGTSEKTVMLGKVPDNKKRGKPSKRWIDSINEAVVLSLQDVSHRRVP